MDGRGRRPLRFLLLATLALAAVAFVAAHLPPRAKLIVLFPAAVGAIAGALVAEIASRNGVRSRRTIVLTAAALGPLMFVEYAAESYRVFRGAREDEVVTNLLKQPGGRAVLDRVRSPEPPANRPEADMLAAYRGRMNPPFEEYAVARLRGLPVPDGRGFAVGLLVAELLLGCAACVVTAAVMSRPRASTASAAEPEVGP